MDETPSHPARIIGALLDELYTESGVEWQKAFNGERLDLAIRISETDLDTRWLEFPDGVRQTASPVQFDALRCAAALRKVAKARKL